MMETCREVTSLVTFLRFHAEFGVIFWSLEDEKFLIRDGRSPKLSYISIDTFAYSQNDGKS